MDEMKEDFLATLRRVNGERAEAWLMGQKSDPLFWAVELGGEVGEILNVVKKLVREELGWRGSRATVQDLADEIADGIICLDSLARHYGIDLASAVATKFNATSDKNGFPHKIAALTTARAEAEADKAEIARLREALRQADFSLQVHAIGAAVLRDDMGLVEKLVKQSDAIKDLLARAALGEQGQCDCPENYCLPDALTNGGICRVTRTGGRDHD